jgi:hypothetical protein
MAIEIRERGFKMDLDLSGLDELQDIPHDFEIDLNCVVVANYGFTLEAIDRSEDQELSKIDEGFGHEGREIVNSIMSHQQNFYEDLRQAVRRLALVALVTRLQHWIGRFVKQLKVNPGRPNLANQLEALNKTLGVGPVPVLFFEELVTVRDSIIHADSRTEWTYQRIPRRVSYQYSNPYGDVELSDEQLKDAIQKAIQQVKWYDQKASTVGPKQP